MENDALYRIRHCYNAAVHRWDSGCAGREAEADEQHKQETILTDALAQLGQLRELLDAEESIFAASFGYER